LNIYQKTDTAYVYKIVWNYCHTYISWLGLYKFSSVFENSDEDFDKDIIACRHNQQGDI